jgi:MoaA/NifB/PqqE/SkfB family radical SAM enzyme
MDNDISEHLNRNNNKFMQWDITKKCNLKCKHCRSVDYYDGKKGEGIIDLSTKEVFKVIDDIARNGVTRIHFLGGEPFMMKDLL